MSTSPKISIIVPVYKVEQYLRRCLDSIVAQTFTDWECILIDDGSPDASGKICDEYASRDSRFRVIHQENKGVSATRNAGLDVAQGEWIGFVDSDDWIEKAYLEVMYRSLENSADADLVLCKVEDTAGIKSYSSDKNYMYCNGKYGVYFRACWGKLFRRSVIEKNEIRFPVNITLAEDTVFTFAFLCHSPRYIFENKPLYHYFDTRETSIVHNVTLDVVYSACSAVSQMENYTSKNQCENRFKKDLFDLKRACKNTFCKLVPPDYCKARNNFLEINAKLFFFCGEPPFRTKLFDFLLVTHLLDYIRPVYRAIKKCVGAEKK